ncbi:hypothetical protein hmeg3_10835 [Herbaspirillum sp. meg3]|uniref:hypothetical protein n=1 Tax=Herbaspirillum sp. meg3 TaxID=2025949 RepID=UPI000B98ED7F|nr:hypothetical protein [Herbaspirillum sp. meg3]ASU38737.1 hypothetical protein hmeg3_10835 [Herbaspirillum sp. meg3]
MKKQLVLLLMAGALSAGAHAQTKGGEGDTKAGAGANSANEVATMRKASRAQPSRQNARKNAPLKPAPRRRPLVAMATTRVFQPIARTCQVIQARRNKFWNNASVQRDWILDG